MSDYWFKPRRYGYGATPQNWQGWAFTLAFFIILMAFVFLPQALKQIWGADIGIPGLIAWLLIVGGATFAFTRVARAKTDGEWRWRWGERD